MRFLSRNLLLLLTIFISFGVSFTSGSNLPDQGPSATGVFDTFSDHGGKLHIEFHAEVGLDGRTTGETTFRDESEVPLKESSSPSTPEHPAKPLLFKAAFDCLVIKGNKAVMSGTITESTWERYVGRRVLVVAEENGGPADPSKRDRLTWGVYREPPAIDRVVSDAERPDEFAGRSWLATDAERPEDEGVQSNHEDIITCQSFPLSSFTFVTANQGKGKVHVKP